MSGIPEAVKYSSEMDVFVKGIDGCLWKDTWNGSSWSGFSSLGGTLARDPSPVAFGSELDVFIRSSVDAYVWKIAWNGSSWSGWNALGGTYAGITVGLAFGSEMDVYVRGNDGALWKDTWNGSSWSGFNSLGGVVVGDPAAIQYNSEMDVYVWGTTGAIWKQTWNGSSWSGWNPFVLSSLSSCARLLAPLLPAFQEIGLIGIDEACSRLAGTGIRNISTIKPLPNGSWCHAHVIRNLNAFHPLLLECHNPRIAQRVAKKERAGVKMCLLTKGTKQSFFQ